MKKTKEPYIFHKSLSVPLYRVKFVIVLTNSRELARKIILNFGSDDVYASAYFGRYRKKTAVFTLLNFDNQYRNVTHGCVAHEALHAANFIADYVGIQPSLEDDEAMSYLIEWITDEIYKFANEKGFKPSLNG